MMNTLQNQARNLQRAAYELLYPSNDNSTLYAENFSRMNAKIFAQANRLYGTHGKTLAEEASICLALLMGYHATFCNAGKTVRVQNVLKRCWNILDRLPDSLLKVHLLAFCYSEVFDERLAAEAHAIMKNWSNRPLTSEEIEVMEMFEYMEAETYPVSVLADERFS